MSCTTMKQFKPTSWRHLVYEKIKSYIFINYIRNLNYYFSTLVFSGFFKENQFPALLDAIS